MERYEFLLAFHVVAVIIWLGASFLLAVMVANAEGERDRPRLLGYYRDIGWLSKVLFIPASLSVLILGILLVIDGPWSFDQLWIVIGLVGYLVSFALGFFYFRPTGERVAELIQAHGPDHPEIDRLVAPMPVVDRLQVFILFLVVADMIFKPTVDDDAGLLLTGLVILAIAVVLTGVGVRSRARTAV